MTIAAGTRFGPYEILTSLGAGGMGEVYRARDTKLGRDVALKILPAAFASDPDRLARFEREARTLAALNHPHIAQIYGFEDRALAMELVEGEDLAERIGRGPVPLDEALPIARQIADALQAAHDQGIIHRDLKPANIKLRADGFVKVLDFGLAKALSLDSSLNTLPSSLTAATLTSPAVTAAGIILGTASYMSPEQARGKAVDTRADVWAFGVVLYEMLTGALPFAGETTTDVLAAVVRADVDFAHLPAATPLSIRRLLRRCLAKDPSRRLRDMADTRLEIDDAIADPPESAAATVAAPASRRPRRWFIVGLLAVLAALIPFAVMGVRHLRERVALLPEIRFDVPSSVPTIAGSDAASFALSPDARHLAYIDGDRQLWIRSMDSPTPRLLPGATDVRYLVWSPDGRAIAFNAGKQLKRINADGSGLTTLMALPSFFGMTWGEGAVLLVAITEGIVRLPAGGGEQTVVVPAIADRVYGSPRFVAGGRFVFLSAPKSLGPRRKVHAASLDSPQPTELFEADAPKVEFVGSGFLLMVEQGTLYARPFDRTRFAVTGEPVAVMRDVAPFSAVDGAIAYRPPTTGGLLQLAWLDRSGRVLESVGEALQMGAEVELAPDGRQAATVRMVNGNFDLWLVETARGVASRVTTTPTLTRWPTWSPDGRRLVYAEANDLHAIDVDGSGAPQVLFADPQQKMPSDMAPDGKHLIYRAQTNADPRGDLWILPLEGEPKPVPFSVTEARETRAQFSPDGRWVSYDSDESGRMEVYVRPFQRPGARVRVSIDGGVEGRWHANGREMFFVDPQGQLMSVALRPSADGRALDVERPRALFHTRLLGGGSYPANFKFHYDVSRDGERFLMLQASDEATAATIAVVANWVPRPR